MIVVAWALFTLGVIPLLLSPWFIAAGFSLLG